MLKIVMTKGLPASGKSTWAKEFVAQNPDWVRISKDDIREELGGDHSRQREKQVIEIRNSRTVCALAAEHNVIIDDTNFNPVHYNKMKEIARSMGNVVVEWKDFTHVPLETCIERDKNRPNPVGETVIRDMYNKYLRQPEKAVPYPVDPKLPWAIIVDMDGTLALSGHRSPYDASKAMDDTLNYPVANAVEALARHMHYNIIICSGRELRHFPITLVWLSQVAPGIADKTVAYLFRPDGDKRKDSIVKKELFDKHIRGKYNIHSVFDDRQQVVDMWRNELGLTCFQVAEGNF